MLKIGRLEINGDGKWPKSRVAMKAELRSFARSLGLELRFVTRKKNSTSWCQPSTARAIVCEGVGREIYPTSWLAFSALHEISHWIQYNEGKFQKIFGSPYYDDWLLPEIKDLRRLGLRAERHANWIARRLAKELFGSHAGTSNLYDGGSTSEVKAFLKDYYGT